MTLTFVDAAYASSITGGPYDGVCFYIGGDAYHVWTLPEVQARPEQYRLPVWVRSDPAAVNPGTDAAACVAALHAFTVPAGSLVAVDTETAVDPSWMKTFTAAVNNAGFRVIDYGTQSDVLKNENPDGYYWGADWTGVAHIAAGDVMTQYVSFANEDVSGAEATLPFWNVKGVPVTPVPVVQTAAQSGWRFCDKCQGLFYGQGEPLSHCPAGGTHDGSKSGNYVLIRADV